MSTSRNVSSSRNPLKQHSYGASALIHRNSFRGLPIKLPGTPHEIQMKLHCGVELLLVHLKDWNEPCCSLRYLEVALNVSDLQELMKKLGISLKTTTIRNAGLLPDIINLRSGIAEPEPILIDFQTVNCLLKNLGLGPREVDEVTTETEDQFS